MVTQESATASMTSREHERNMGSTLQGRAEWLLRRHLQVFLWLLRNAAASYCFGAGVQVVVSGRISVWRAADGSPRVRGLVDGFTRSREEMRGVAGEASAGTGAGGKYLSVGPGGCERWSASGQDGVDDVAMVDVQSFPAWNLKLT